MDGIWESEELQNVEKLEDEASTNAESDVQQEIFSSLSEVLRVKTWAILDIEYIQTTRSHKCLRKLYMLEKGAFSSLEEEFFPCLQYQKEDKSDFVTEIGRFFKGNIYL